MTGGLVGTGLGMRVRRLPRGGRAKPAIAIPHHALLFVNADIGLAAKLGCGVHLKSARRHGAQGIAGIRGLWPI